MAFGFRSSGNAMTGAAPGPAGVSEGPELELIQTEALGFKSIAGDAKLRLTTPWSPPPADTASLITIAARKGLVAAAGPDGIVTATTDAVRKGFDGEKEGDSDVRVFQPQLKLPLSMRVSHIAFTADETYLLLSAESGGGLAVYDTQSLLQGNTQAAFELATNGESLRALAPNPTAEKADLCAIVTNNGNLHMASLKEKKISNPLKSQVSCVSWSTRGKQLLAGLADGTIHQMTPEGEAKAEIPRPPSVTNAHVASLSWLENHVILAIHTNTNESPPSSTYHIITRQPPSSFTFQKMTDPVDPFGAERVPHHSIMRLKDFPPNLQDLLIVASTASPDIGLISRSKTPLSPDKPAESISNVFTTTELLDDSKRAQLPMSESMDNTTAVGVALDLSSKDKVYKPLPADEEIEESPGPLPGYWVLNNEGVLSSWWIVYEDSIRQGTSYPSLAALDGSAQTAAPATMSAPAAPAVAPAVAPAFSASTGTSAFGSTPAFGGSSGLGAKPSPWGTSQTSTGTTGGQPSTAFGGSSSGSGPASSAPAFGKTSALGFGQSSQIGPKTSPWGAAGSTAPNASSASATPAFGQSGFGALGGGANKSVFDSSTSSNTAASVPTSGGFAGFAGSGGFAAAGANTSGGSIFSSKPSSGSPFGSAAQTLKDSSTAFPAPKSGGSGLALNAGSFKLDSSFKPDPATKDDNEKPSSAGGSSLFGSNFGAALGDAAQQTSKDEDMDTSTTPQPTQTKSSFNLGGAPSATESKSPFGLFGSQSKAPFAQATETKSPGLFGSTPPADQKTPPAKSAFGLGSTETTPQANPAFSLGGAQPKSPFTLNGHESTTPTTTPAPSKFGFQTTSDTPKGSIFGSTATSGGLFKTSEPAKPAAEAKHPEIKVESPGEAPLPPESTSRNAYPLGESSSSSGTWTDVGSKTSKADDAPLPPDFVKPAKPAGKPPSPPDTLSTPKPSTSGGIFSSLSEKKPASSTPSQPFTFPSVTQDAYSDSSDEGSTDGSQLGEEAPLPPDFVKKAPVKEAAQVPAVPDSEGASDLGEEEGDAESEGSGVMVGKDTSPSTTGFAATPGYTPQSSFGGMSGSTFIIPPAQSDMPRGSLFGELGRAQVLPRPNATSPRSPSPVRSAIPSRVSQPSGSRSVSAPGMASQILGGSRRSGHQMGLSTVANRLEEDPQLRQQRQARSRREAEETKVLEDEEDDEIQRILASDMEPTLVLDDFIAHTNVVPSSQETIPSQVEAVYRDINSMIDMLGLNARSMAGFIQGHSENYKEGGRHKEDLENPDDWVLCEVDELGDVLDTELAQELENGRVQDVEGKLEACHDLTREMSRLRSKQEDLKKLITVRLDPEQAEVSRSLPLSAEQATQQNELRREYGKFMRQLAEAEETLTLLKTKLAPMTATSGKSTANVPTVDAVMRTIHKMTSMAEKRSGDIDVLENQLRKLRFSSADRREGSPLAAATTTTTTTPQRNSHNNRSVVFSPDSAAGGSPRASTTHNPPNSLMSSVASAGGGGGGGATPRKKLSGFSRAEKVELMEKKAKRRAVLDKLKANIKKNGVQPWPMPEDTE